MKCLSLILNESSKQEVVDLLRHLPIVSTYTIFSGEGRTAHGVQPFESAHDEVVGYVPRIRIDLIVEDEAVADVVERIRQSCTCVSRGAYWVTALDEMGML